MKLIIIVVLFISVNIVSQEAISCKNFLYPRFSTKKDTISFSSGFYGASMCGYRPDYRIIEDSARNESVPNDRSYLILIDAKKADICLPAFGCSTVRLKLHNLEYGYYTIKVNWINSDSDVDSSYSMPFDTAYFTISGSVFVKNTNLKKEKYAPVTIYPNPFSQTTTIYLSNLKRPANLFIYDTKGKIVRAFNNIKSKKINLDSHNMISGVYTLKFITGNKINSKKIILQ